MAPNDELRLADALFGLPPGEFIAARDALAAELRAQGDRAGATAVKGLRRPTLVAWAANQVARAEPAMVDALLASGEALVREQRRLLSGVSGADVRGPSRARRDAVDAAVDAAAAHLRRIDVDPATHRDKLVATFEAASLGGPDGERLQAGRLDRDLRPTASAALGGGLSLVPDVAEGGPDEPADSDGDATADGKGAGSTADANTASAPDARVVAAAREAEEGAERARSARAAAEQASATLVEAQAEAERAEAAVEAARQEVEAAEAALATAREEAERAEGALQERQAAVAPARTAAERAEDEARSAEADAEDLAEDARRAAARAAR